MKKKTMALLLTLVFGGVLIACGSGGTDEAGDAAPAAAEETAEEEVSEEETGAAEEAATEEAAVDNSDIKIGYICGDLTNQGWLIINDGVQNAAKDLGVDFQLVTTTTGDVGSFLNAFEDLRNMNCDAIVFGAAQVEAIDAIEKAVADGIPCIEIDTPSGAEGTYTIGISNYDAAVAGAKWMAEAIGNQGTVICLNGSQSMISGQERRNGFIETMNEIAPDVEIFEADMEWNQEMAMNATEDALTSLNNEVDGIYTAWDGATVAVVPVLEQRGLTGKVKLLGFDGAADVLGLMKEGKVDADVGQPLYKMGYEGVVTALKVARGEAVDDTAIKLPTEVITPDRIDDYIEEAGLSSYVK